MKLEVAPWPVGPEKQGARGSFNTMIFGMKEVGLTVLS